MPAVRLSRLRSTLRSPIRPVSRDTMLGCGSCSAATAELWVSLSLANPGPDMKVLQQWVFDAEHATRYFSRHAIVDPVVDELAWTVGLLACVEVQGETLRLGCKKQSQLHLITHQCLQISPNGACISPNGELRRHVQLLSSSIRYFAHSLQIYN